MAYKKKIEYYQNLINTTGFHAPIGETINMGLISISPGHARLDLQADARHLNSLGTVQGGVLTIMADAAMGIAYASLLDTDQKFTTVELKINFIKSIKTGYLSAFGSVTHSGTRTGISECKIFLINPQDDEKLDLVAIANSTLILL